LKEEHMKKQLLLITIVLIAIIAVASAAGAYYLTLPKNENPTPTPTPAPTSTLNPTSTPSLVAALSQDQGAARALFTSEVLQAGQPVNGSIFFSSTASDSLVVTAVSLHFDWMPTGQVVGYQLTAPVTIDSNSSHLFDPMQVQIPLTIDSGTHTYYIGIDGTENGVPFSWDSPTLNIDVAGGTGNVTATPSNTTATNPPAATASPTPVPTSTPTPTPTASHSPTPSPTPTASPSPTPTASPSPTPIPTPSVGYARSNPAPIGTELVTMFPYSGTSLSLGSVKITEVIRGTEAWTQIHAANMYNSAPTAGNEYILVKIYFRYAIGLTADTSYTVSQYNFYAISENGLQYTSQAVVTPTPRFDAALYPGASIEGWAAYQVAITDTHPLLAFARNYDGTGGIWFKLY
jgi:cell division septation protein DedD